MSTSILQNLTNETIQQTLIKSDPKLMILFKTVKPEVFASVFKSPYVALLGVLVGQIISYTQARKIRRAIYQRWGTYFDLNTIEAVSDNELLILGLSETKIKLIRRVNSFLLENKIILHQDWNKLKEIKGIGEWTILSARLTSQNESNLDLFPCGDYFLRQRVKRLYQLDKIPSIKEMRTISQKWSPYRSIVCWWLWRWF